MRASVVTGWRAWNEPNEGWVPFMYTDDAPPSAAFPNGIVTVGMGNALESVGAAQAAGFVNPDGSLTDAATVASQWQAVHDGPHNSSTGAGYLTTIRLPDAAIQALIDQTLDANEVVLAHYFPGWASFPADGQAAIMSKTYAMGTGVFPATFPNFVAAVNRGDWQGAIAAGAYHGVGTEKRQAQEALALANAQAVVDGGLDPATLYWPNAAPTGALARVKSWAPKVALVAGLAAAGSLAIPDVRHVALNGLRGLGRWLSS